MSPPVSNMKNKLPGDFFRLDFLFYFVHSVFQLQPYPAVQSSCQLCPGQQYRYAASDQEHCLTRNMKEKLICTLSLGYEAKALTIFHFICCDSQGSSLQNIFQYYVLSKINNKVPGCCWYSLVEHLVEHKQYNGFHNLNLPMFTEWSAHNRPTET